MAGADGPKLDGPKLRLISGGEDIPPLPPDPSSDACVKEGIDVCIKGAHPDKELADLVGPSRPSGTSVVQSILTREGGDGRGHQLAVAVLDAFAKMILSGGGEGSTPETEVVS